MESFELLAHPFWVNFFILTPVIIFFLWYKTGLQISRNILLASAVFGVAMGYWEAATVVYLRSTGSMLAAAKDFGQMFLDKLNVLPLRQYDPTLALMANPELLFRLEVMREIATIILLLVVAFISAGQWRERFAIFLWTFAIWDIVYYLGLFLATGWPQSLTVADVLFLIPVPWVSQVWFPILVSGLTVTVILFLSWRRSEERP